MAQRRDSVPSTATRSSLSILGGSRNNYRDRFGKNLVTRIGRRASIPSPNRLVKGLFGNDHQGQSSITGDK